MPHPAFARNAFRTLAASLAAALLLSATAPAPLHAHDRKSDTPRVAVVSAFAPEVAILRQELTDASEHSLNGVTFATGMLEGRQVVLFLSGISVVNAAMTVQLALDHFTIKRIVFSGIAVWTPG